MKTHLVDRRARLKNSSYKPCLKVLGEKLTPSPSLIIFNCPEVVEQNGVRGTRSARQKMRDQASNEPFTELEQFADAVAGADARRRTSAPL